MKPFEIINNLSYDQKELSDDDLRGYNAFLTNRQFSYFPDTFIQAETLNLLPDIPPKAQYSYYINSIKPRKRFTKWVKPERDDDITAVMEYYNLNYSKAKDAISILSETELDIVKQKINKGG